MLSLKEYIGDKSYTIDDHKAFHAKAKKEYDKHQAAMKVHSDMSDKFGAQMYAHAEHIKKLQKLQSGSK